jgi:hypothetical protein
MQNVSGLEILSILLQQELHNTLQVMMSAAVMLKAG